MMVIVYLALPLGHWNSESCACVMVVVLSSTVAARSSMLLISLGFIWKNKNEIHLMHETNLCLVTSTLAQKNKLWNQSSHGNRM